MTPWIPTASLLAMAIAFALTMTAAVAPPISPTARQAPPEGIYLETPAGKKPRVVITADPELDDLNSLIRYVLMSDGYRTEGLIYPSSQFHWTGDGTGKAVDVPRRESAVYYSAAWMQDARAVVTVP